MLKFSYANAKTERLYDIAELQKYLQNNCKVYSLDLPAGYSCPGARDCLSRCVRGKIQDGKHTQFRCFSASQEAMFPNVHKMRMYNFEAIQAASREASIFKLISDSLPKNAGIIRYHVSGDFFNVNYLRAAYAVACIRKDILFYGYTKSLNLLCRIDCQDLSKGIVLPNFLLTASYGGVYDDLIYGLNMRSAKVVFEESEGMIIDHDDSHAATVGPSFCLLLHGTQPKGSIAAKAWQAIRKAGGGYAR